ncbi:MAG: TauD/TfdA dioxygenase family protein [Hyphomicrobiaceae bacterium]
MQPAPFKLNTTLDVTPVTGALGTHVQGIDLSRAGDQDIDHLRAVLNEHLVLYLPNQNLDRFQLSALGNHFGPPFLHPIVDNGFDDCPDVLELLRKPGQTTMFGGESWHADVTWQKPAGYVSILHGIEIPPVGGDTAFASTQAAFAALSDGMKEMLRGMNAVHTYYWYERREGDEHTVVHPVVRKHPVTGREGLYVNRMFTNRFEDMTVEESAPLLKWLCDHMEKHAFTCRFRWQPGGVIIWDNRFTLHYPINDFSGVRRRMIRTTRLETG